VLSNYVNVFVFLFSPNIIHDLGEQLWPWQWWKRKPEYVLWTV